MKHGKHILLGLLAGIVMMPIAAYASDQSTKPPIIVKQGNTRYIFTTQDDKMRSILLNSKNLRIQSRRERVPDYKSYRWRSRHIRDREEYDARAAAYDSGYAAGYILSRD
jgi:hypothetical protein